MVGSSAILGLNWLRVVVVSSFTRTGEVQVDPLSSECWTWMSMSLLSWGCSEVNSK